MLDANFWQNKTISKKIIKEKKFFEELIESYNNSIKGLTDLSDLYKLAEEEGIKLIIVSGTRSFNHQKDIWDRKWTKPKYMGWEKIEKAKDILTYSSMPGTSRHHWGTDFDLNSLENNYFDSGEGKKVYDFMERCGGEHGFKQVYTSKDGGRTGYEEEKWHWSYMPVSSVMLNQYNELVCISDIRGFDGSEVADSINVIGVFVNGIAE